MQVLQPMSHTRNGILALASFQYPFILYILEYLYWILVYLTCKVLFNVLGPPLIIKKKNTTYTDEYIAYIIHVPCALLLHVHLNNSVKTPGDGVTDGYGTS